MKVHTFHYPNKTINTSTTKALALLVITIFLLSVHPLLCQPSTPTFKAFQPISSGSSKTNISASGFNRNANPLLPNDPHAEQNARTMQQAAANAAQVNTNRQGQLTPDVYMSEDRRLEMEYMHDLKARQYQNSFEQLLGMNPNNFSITKAIYLTESAWHDDPPPFEHFEKEIKLYAETVKQLLQKEGLNAQNNSAINYGVQKLYKQNNTWHDKRTGKTYHVSKLGYDFKDYMGEKEWSSMFVDKLLRTGSGQCHSLPLLYLCIIEQLKGKAYLSLSPNHSFIQYFGTNGKRYDFETTNGNHVNESWLLQSTYVSSIALANKTYLDTLSSRQLFAQILADLLMGYRDRLGYDESADTILQKIQQVDPGNMVAMLMQANLLSYEFAQKLHHLGNPPPSELNQHPDLEQAYNKMHAAYRRIDATGYQEMPPDVYQAWLQSMQQEEQKQQDKAEYDKLLKELKKIKPTFKNTPKQ